MKRWSQKPRFIKFKPLFLKPKVLKKPVSIKTTAKPLWPWFSFIFAVFMLSITGGFFIGTSIVQAQVNVVPQVSIVANTVNVIFSPAQLQQNTTASVTISLKDNDSKTSTISASVGTTASLYICSSANSGCDTAVGSKSSNGRSITFDFGVDSNKFKAGNNFIEGTIELTAHQVTGTTYYTGYAQVNVTAANTSGQATLSINATSDSNPNQNTVTRPFSLTYNVGGTNRQPTSYSLDCGNGTQGTKKTFNGLTTYECTYSEQANTDGTPKVFTVTATASDSKGVIISQSAPTQITGKEYQQGSGSERKNDDSLVTLLNEVISFVIALIQQFLYVVFSIFIAPIIVAVLSIHAYKDSFVAVIYPGWETVRNLCNIFFIVSLIVIAMATLFRVESYKARHLLVQLIIAALLINFSLVIAQAVLAVADTVQAQFLSANVDAVNSLAKQLMTTNNSAIMGFVKIQQTATAQATQTSFFGGLMASLTWLALSTGTFAVFLAIAAFLVIRIVALWLLLMISPIAYAVGVLPSTAQYRTKWWQEFLKYAFFTPIMAFFLNMAAIMATNAQHSQVLADFANNAGITSIKGLSDLITVLASNVLLLVFLIASLKVADLAGVYGAKGITDLATKGIYAPFAGAAWLGQRGGGYVGRKWNEFTANRIRGHGLEVSKTRSALFAVANPKAFIKGWQKHTEELSHSAQAKAEAAGLEVAEQRLTGGKKVIPRVLAHEKEEEDKWAKTYMNMSRELVVQTLRKVAGMKNDDQGLAAKRAIIKVAMAKGYVDDSVQDGTDLDTAEGKALADKMKHNKHFAIRDEKDAEVESYTYVDENGKEQTGTRQKWQRDWEDHPVQVWDDQQKKMVDKIGADGKKVTKRILKYNDLTRRAMYESMFTMPNGHMDTASMRLITEEGEDEGKKTGHFEYLKDMWFDFNKGEWTWRPEHGQYSGGQFAKTELSKMQSRPQAAVAHHSFMDLSDDTNIDEDIFRVFATAAGENPSFMQERTSHQALSRSNQVEFRTNADGSDIIDANKEHVKILKLKKSDVIRIKKMMKISPEAVAGMYLRVTKQGSTPVAVDNFMKAHPNFQIDVEGQLNTVDLRGKEVKVSTGGVEPKWDGKGLGTPKSAAGSGGGGSVTTP